MFNDIITEQIALHMEMLDNRILYLVMYLSTKSGISFQAARAFAIILADSLSVTYLDVASVCKHRQKQN